MSSRRSRKSRHMNLDGIQPEQQVLAEQSGSAGCPQIGIGGRDDAHIHADCPRRADPLDLTSLQHSQQFGLLANGYVPDLVEENRAPIGQFETSDAVESARR